MEKGKLNHTHQSVRVWGKVTTSNRMVNWGLFENMTFVQRLGRGEVSGYRSI